MVSCYSTATCLQPKALLTTLGALFGLGEFGLVALGINQRRELAGGVAIGGGGCPGGLHRGRQVDGGDADRHRARGAGPEG